jgi:hypothetical protein
MARAKVVRARGGPQGPPIPRLALGIGLGATTLAVLSLLISNALDGPVIGPALRWVRLALLGVGLLAAAQAVVWRPRSAVVLGLAAVTAEMAKRGLDAEWDTVHLVLRIATVVAAVAAVLVLLPRAIARVAVSALIVVHFGGILIAVTSVPPPGGPPPWLVSQLWTRFYRPYLQFAYLNNAYHFYSPEPGPACLLWFHLEYTDGSSRWVKIPNREEHAKDPLALEYYRRLSITESTNQLNALPAVAPELIQRRLVTGHLDGIPSPDEIALHYPGLPQYRVPVDHSRHLLQGYARFVARTYRHENAAVEVEGVKVYRVVHAMPQARDVAGGMGPLDPELFLPYYQGEFDQDGNLKDPNDPYLYWLIPILKVEQTPPPAGARPGLPAGPARPGAGAKVRDFVEIHARLRKGE